MNTAAERLLHQLDGELADPLPHAILTVAQRARDQQASGGSSPSCRVQTRAGQWLMVHGTRIGENLAVVMDQARPDELVPIMLRAYELTDREQAAVGLLLRGMSNDEIALSLRISTYTIKQHLKSVFRKVGVASRSELSARMFAEQCVPRIAARTPLGASGWFSR